MIGRNVEIFGELIEVSVRAQSFEFRRFGAPIWQAITVHLRSGGSARLADILVIHGSDADSPNA